MKFSKASIQLLIFIHMITNEALMAKRTLKPYILIFLLTIVFQSFSSQQVCSQVLSKFKQKEYSSLAAASKDTPEIIIGKFRIKNNTIERFNSNGEVTKKTFLSGATELINTVRYSSDKRHIVAYRATEGGTSAIYLFSANGLLINTIKTNNISPKVKFSHNGQHFILLDRFGSVFKIYDVKGSEFYSGKYQELTGSNEAALSQVFISDKMNYLLINTAQKAYYMSLEGEKKWEANHGLFSDCIISEGKGLIFLKKTSRSSTPKSRKYELNIISNSNGELMEKQDHLDALEFNGNKVFIKKESIFLSYEIK